MHIAFVIMAGGGAEAFVQTLLPEFERRGHRVSVIYGHSPRPGQAAFPLRVPVAYAPAGQWHYYLGRIVKQFHAWPRRLRSWEVSRAAGRVLAEMEITSPVDVIDVMEGLPVPPLRARGRVVVRAYGSDWTVRHYCRDGDRYGDRWLIRQEAAILPDVPFPPRAHPHHALPDRY